MSMSLSVQAPARGLVVVGEDARGALRLGRARSEPRDPSSPFGVACCDVIDEVRSRMERRGYRWD